MHIPRHHVFTNIDIPYTTMDILVYRGTIRSHKASFERRNLGHCARNYENAPIWAPNIGVYPGLPMGEKGTCRGHAVRLTAYSPPYPPTLARGGTGLATHYIQYCHSIVYMRAPISGHAHRRHENAPIWRVNSNISPYAGIEGERANRGIVARVSAYSSPDCRQGDCQGENPGFPCIYVL